MHCFQWDTLWLHLGTATVVGLQGEQTDNILGRHLMMVDYGSMD